MDFSIRSGDKKVVVGRGSTVIGDLKALFLLVERSLMPIACLDNYA